MDLAANIFKQIPENIDYEGTAKILALDPCPLNVVLLQEVMLKRSKMFVVYKENIIYYSDDFFSYLTDFSYFPLKLFSKSC